LCFYCRVFVVKRLAQRVTDISYTEATVDWKEWESESDSDIADTEQMVALCGLCPW